MGLNISGTQEGLIPVDLQTGLANSIIEQTISGEMSFVVEEEEITVPMNIRQTIQVESLQPP